MKKVLLAAFSQVTTATFFAVDQNLASLVGVLVSTVGIVMIILNWLDKRIDHKINGSTQKISLRFELVLAEIRHVKALMGHPEPPEPVSPLHDVKE